MNEQQLKAIYNKYNQSHFSGALPDIPVFFSNMKTKAGEFRSIVKRKKYCRPKLDSIQGVFISSFYHFDDLTIERVMLHEMIHVDLAIKGIIDTSGPDKHHGYEFEDRMQELNQQLPFEVMKKTTDAQQFMPKSSTTRSYPVAIITFSDEGRGIISFSENYWSANADKIHNYLKEALSRDITMVSIKLGHTTSVATKSFKAKRSLTSLEIYTLNDDSHADICASFAEASLLSQLLEPETLKRCAAHADPAACITHNFLDSNQVMLNAFENVCGRSVSFDSEDDIHLLAEAWNLARENEFYVSELDKAQSHD